MASPTVHGLPSREQLPLHALSPERMNTPRSGRSRRMAATDPEAVENPSIPPTSPSRKNTVFADFSFGGRTPVKETGFALPQSPSLPEITSLRTHHVRTNSDVQGLVKRFEHLDVRDREAESAERRKRHEAELRRAQIAREEAESDVKKLREEVRRLKKEGDDGHERERRVGKRLEVVMEEYATSKETYASQAAVYEKEVRRARKEAFKSSSVVLKLTEELKSTRNFLRAAQSNLDLEKRKVQQKEQETFSAQYQYVALQEELETLQTHVRVIEEEKEALKTNLQEEEVARIAAEGRIALPYGGHDDEDLLSSPTRRSPQKGPRSPLSDDKENVGVVTKKVMEAKRLAEELTLERTRREHAEELADFMRLECQFKCCSCRSPNDLNHGSVDALAGEFAHVISSIRESMLAVITPFERLGDRRMSETSDTLFPAEADTVAERVRERVAPAVLMEIDMQHELENNLQEGTAISASEAQDDLEDAMLISEEDPQAPHSTPADLDPPSDAEAAPAATPVKIPLRPQSPQTPPQAQHNTPFHQQPSIRTVTTTTKVPMQFTPARPSSRDVENGDNLRSVADAAHASSNGPIPATFDREAALAAIAYRRGRAKSIADGHMTPRKQMIEGVSMKERRDISAPALGQKVGGMNVAKGAASVGRATGARKF